MNILRKTAPAVLLAVLSGGLQAGDDPELGALISGTTSYVDGVHVWTDYAYDDRGPDTDGLRGGDATYPDNPYPGNTADFIQLQLGTGKHGSLQVTAVLETLVDGADALIGVGFDSDRLALTGAATLPGGQWLHAEPLGLDYLLLLPTDGGAGQLLKWQGMALQPVGSFPVSVDRERNTVSAEITALQPGTATWRAVGVIGMSSAEGSWFNGAHAIFDLAYVRGEDPVMDPEIALTEQVPQLNRPWQDKIQADILEGELPPWRAVASVAFGTDRSELPEPGSLETFLYHSRLTLEEGIRQNPLQWRGVYQPYVVLIPEGLPPEPPAVVFMHGANQNHLVNAVHFSPNGVVIQGAYDVPAVVIFPNGRDTNWSTGLAEQDLLDATDDAIARLELDADRIVLSGISAGGYGTFRHVARYPDRWTGGYSIVGGGTARLENLTNVPFRAHNGLLDPLVNAQVWQDSADALAAAGTVDYRTVLVDTSSHIPEEAGNCWYLDLLSRPRAINPPRVRYTVDPQDFFVDPARNLNLSPDGAYWVSELTSRDGNPAGIDVVSLARADRQPVATDIDRRDENITKGADFCGPNPALQTGDEWRELGREFAPGDPQPVENGMQASFGNLSHATLDLARMGITTSDTVTVHSISDGFVTLRLLGTWNGRITVLRDGAVVDQFVAREAAEIAIESGEHVYTLKTGQ